jgi:hypothetical protein
MIDARIVGAGTGSNWTWVKEPSTNVLPAANAGAGLQLTTSLPYVERQPGNPSLQGGHQVDQPNELTAKT